MKVIKFGGSSLADDVQIRKVGDIIVSDPERRVVVVSAPGKGKNDPEKVTDMLIRTAETALAQGREAGRAELQKIIDRYAAIAEKLGVPRRRVVRRHILPHLLPQFLTGLILQFPHAILHEASVTFLGFGLSPEQPAIGVILSESMRYLTTGKWWLALFPGLALVLVVLLFAGMGERLRRLLDPASVHQ